MKAKMLKIALAGLSLVLLATVSHAQKQGTIIKKNGGTVVGTLKWLPSSKVFVVTDANGIQLRVAWNEIKDVVVKDPPELASAIKLVQGGQHALAIPNLEKIVKDYEMMGPDLKAARYLGEAYLKGVGNAAKAVEVFEKIISSNPSAASSGEMASIYWDALLAANRIPKLKSALGDAVAEGSRSVAAVALVKRGDIEKKEGNLKNALVDGYLRTVILFQDIKDAQPEALFKAAKCFEELGQMSHADKMRKKLLAEFPEDHYSQQLKQGT